MAGPPVVRRRPVDFVSWDAEAAWYTLAAIGCTVVIVPTVTLADTVHFDRPTHATACLLVLVSAVVLHVWRGEPEVRGFSVGLALGAGVVLPWVLVPLVVHPGYHLGIFGVHLVLGSAVICAAFPFVNGDNPVHVLGFGVSPPAALAYGVLYVGQWAHTGYDPAVLVIVSVVGTIPLLAWYAVIHPFTAFLTWWLRR